MRRLALTLTLAGVLVGATAAPVAADVSTTQTLPAAACNAGTMNAHESVPETTGTGLTTPAHAYDTNWPCAGCVKTGEP